MQFTKVTYAVAMEIANQRADYYKLLLEHQPKNNDWTRKLVKAHSLYMRLYFRSLRENGGAQPDSWPMVRWGLKRRVTIRTIKQFEKGRTP